MPTAQQTRREIIKPLVRNIVQTKDVVFSASCFEGDGWSLGPLQWPADVQKNPQLDMKLSDALVGHGVRRAYAPNPTKFNAKIISPQCLSREILLSGGMSLFRNQDIHADGTMLARGGDAGIFSAGGCGVIVAALGDELFFAHAGRECVIDRQRILTGNPSRTNESIVHSIVQALAPVKWLRQQLQAWVFYSIKPEDFVHRFDDPDPKHAAYNKAAADSLQKEYPGEYGWSDNNGVHIDLPKIMQAQFRELDVEYVSLEHAYLADELPTTRNGGGRYLVAIVRH
jgi:hypothetical protein